MTTTIPIPEAPETLEAQVAWLVSGKRRAVLVTWGEMLPPLPANVVAVPAPEGLVVYCPEKVAASEVVRCIQEGALGELLGYGVSRKPEDGQECVCVVIRDANGVEKQSVVVDEATKDKALEAAVDLADRWDTVNVEPASQTITGRLNALQRRELVLRPVDGGVEGLRKLAKLADKYPASFKPLGVTHVVERGGEVVGWLGLSSLPMYRLAIPVDDVSVQDVLAMVRTVENNYRMQGVRVLATVLDTGCRSYAYKERCGYLEQSSWRLCLKTL